MATLSERINSSSEQIRQILQALFLPKEFGNGFRLASEGAGNKSACANMSLSYDSSSWESTTADTWLLESQLMVFLFANPLRSYIQYDHNPSGNVAEYLVSAVDGTTSWAIPASTNGERIATELIPRWATANSSYAPHGPILFPGYDRCGHYYLFVSTGDVTPVPPATAYGLVVSLSVAPVAANAGNIRWYVWSGKAPFLWYSETITTNVQNYSCVVPDGGAYMYAVVEYTENVANQTASLTIREQSYVWQHHCVSDINSLLTQAYGIRVNSATIRVQNDAAPLSREGMIVSATIGANSSWQTVSLGTDYLMNVQLARDRTADRGYYGIVLPDSDDDVSEFYSDISASAFSTAPTLTQAAFPLNERRPYKAIAINVATSAGRSFTFDVTHTIEYLTNNKLVGQNVSDFSEKSLEAAIVIASTMETDYDNPVHWRDILQTIATYLPLGAKVLTSALQLFNYNDIANQIEARQPSLDRFSNNLAEISQASAKNKRKTGR